ncbi:uncharacterized protein BDZ99DRAFT_496096 [Mytilinidion resinicola]|uniref:Protein kinase domain-containing protein n=1 Tax=Mytilinidion resinicola TaxID=574789 RepID=A0A6A6YW47_9PEZI|nr:uncharacterized protein BDZ99DRAFT_496096 [Mytilinidion resinicola]KAF2813000.1 hypothetical protein BDZ99DRAFT_496096 [Mytilinidion resinicola]
MNQGQGQGQPAQDPEGPKQQGVHYKYGFNAYKAARGITHWNKTQLKVPYRQFKNLTEQEKRGWRRRSTRFIADHPVLAAQPAVQPVAPPVPPPAGPQVPPPAGSQVPPGAPGGPGEDVLNIGPPPQSPQRTPLGVLENTADDLPPGDWKYVKSVGKGSYGEVDLWIYTDEQNNTIQDRMARKRELTRDPNNPHEPSPGVHNITSAALDDPEEPEPKEITVLRETRPWLHRNIPTVRGLFKTQKSLLEPGTARSVVINVWTTYMNFAQYGSLGKLLDDYIESSTKNSPAPVYFPEVFVWSHYQKLDPEYLGWVHADMKPDNVLLDAPKENDTYPGYPVPILADFGITDDDTGPCYGGTWAYAAPEQFLGWADTNIRFSVRQEKDTPPAQQEIQATDRTMVWEIGMIIWSMTRLSDGMYRTNHPGHPDQQYDNPYNATPQAPDMRYWYNIQYWTSVRNDWAGANNNTTETIRPVPDIPRFDQMGEAYENAYNPPDPSEYADTYSARLTKLMMKSLGYDQKQDPRIRPSLWELVVETRRALVDWENKTPARDKQREELDRCLRIRHLPENKYRIGRRVMRGAGGGPGGPGGGGGGENGAGGGPPEPEQLSRDPEEIPESEANDHAQGRVQAAANPQVGNATRASRSPSEPVRSGTNRQNEGEEIPRSETNDHAEEFATWILAQYRAEAAPNQQVENATQASGSPGEPARSDTNRQDEGVGDQPVGDGQPVHKGQAPSLGPPSWIWSDADGGYWHCREFNAITGVYERKVELAHVRRRRQEDLRRQAQEAMRALVTYTNNRLVRQAAEQAPVNSGLPSSSNIGLAPGTGAESSNVRAMGKRKRTAGEAGRGNPEDDPQFDPQASGIPRKRRNLGKQ